MSVSSCLPAAWSAFASAARVPEPGSSPASSAVPLLVAPLRLPGAGLNKGPARPAPLPESPGNAPTGTEHVQDRAAARG